MQRNVIRSLIWRASALALLAGAFPAAAQNGEGNEAAERSVTEEHITARDVAATPIRDLNLEKDEIPALLLAAQDEPYSTAGLRRCSNYVSAVQELDHVLGPDFDLTEVDDRKLSVGGVARSVVGSLIPFRGVIREISGARRHEQRFQDAILAGMMRRSFLKGMGLRLGCAYPARPAGDAERAAFVARQADRADRQED